MTVLKFPSLHTPLSSPSGPRCPAISLKISTISLLKHPRVGQGGVQWGRVRRGGVGQDGLAPAMQHPLLHKCGVAFTVLSPQMVLPGAYPCPSKRHRYLHSTSLGWMRLSMGQP